MNDDWQAMQTVADYQFGSGAGERLFSSEESLSMTRTSSGRPRQLKANEERVATYETDGRFRLGMAGGRLLQDAGVGYRVVVGDESRPYVSEGRNAFAKFVVDADEAIRPRDDVVVEHTDGTVLAVGRAELSGDGMASFETGMAVKVRDSVK
ncbi:PUA domain-containing protein [Halovenus marina]|uniref:PUA domain-containing protein n=1 Tax=Halovenus marina TaxID=3396621 RepID=UPI003F55A4AC